MQAGYWVNLLIGVATLAAVAGLAVTHQLTPAAGIVVMALSAICHAVLGLGGMLQQAPGLGFSATLARQCLGFGGVMFLAQAANTVHFKADQVLVNLWLGPAALGGYAVAVRWAEMLFLLDQVLSSAFMRDAVAGDVRQSWQVTRRLSLVQGAISILAGGALMALAGPIVHYGYGVAFADAVLPMILLVPGLVAWSVSKFSSQFLIFRLGETRFVVATAVAGLGLNFLLLWLFVQRWQGALPGAALASTCSYLFVSVMIMARAARRVAQTLPATEVAGP
jgi:O-antigen/teichoic acid export membrane protein